MSMNEGRIVLAGKEGCRSGSDPRRLSLQGTRRKPGSDESLGKHEKQGSRYGCNDCRGHRAVPGSEEDAKEPVKAQRDGLNPRFREQGECEQEVAPSKQKSK